MIHQDCYNKYYTINYHEDHIEIEIKSVPKDNHNKGKLYFDLVVYYEINNTIIKYKNEIFLNEEELNYFLNVSNKTLLHFFNTSIKLFL